MAKLRDTKARARPRAAPAPPALRRAKLAHTLLGRRPHGVAPPPSTHLLPQDPAARSALVAAHTKERMEKTKAHPEATKNRHHERSCKAPPGLAYDSAPPAPAGGSLGARRHISALQRAT